MWWQLSEVEWEALPAYKETSWSVELKARYEGAKLIQQIGQRLRLPPVVISTAQVYLHRFYTRYRFSEQPSSVLCLGLYPS